MPKKRDKLNGNKASRSSEAQIGQSAARSSYLFLLAAWLIYVLIVMPAWNAPFIFDDGPGIVENPAIAGLSIQQVFFGSPSDATPYGRPIVSASLAINQAVAGFTPWAFRFFNLLLHGANALLVYLFLRRLLRMAPSGGDYAEPVALASAILWMFHPLGTNVSLYIVQRAEGLVSFFLLLALYAACRALRDNTGLLGQVVNEKGWRWLTILFCALGMLSKESMVIAPVAIYLLDASLVSRSLLQPFRQRGRWYLGLASTWILLAGVMLTWPRKYSVGTESGLGSLQYFVVQMEVLTSYLAKALWPQTLHLDYWIFEPSGWGAVLFGFVLLGILFLASGIGSWKGNPVGYLGLLAFVVLAPTSTFVPVRSMPGAEYRFYLPLMAIIVLGTILLWMLAHWFSKKQGVAIFMVLVVAWGIGLAARTNARASDYSNPEAIWLQVKEAFPKNVRALNALGSIALENDDFEKARKLFLQSVEFHPEHGDAYANLGMLEGEAGNLEAALELLEKSVQLWPFNPTTWSNLGITYEGLGDSRASEQAFLKSLKLGPHLPEPNFNLGVLYLRKERWDEGRAQIRRVLQLDPRHPGANSIRQQLMSAGMWSEF
jgi:hypothetical protein